MTDMDVITLVSVIFYGKNTYERAVLFYPILLA